MAAKKKLSDLDNEMIIHPENPDWNAFLDDLLEKSCGNKIL